MPPPLSPPRPEWCPSLINPEARMKAWRELSWSQRTCARRMIERHARGLRNHDVKPPPPQWCIPLISPAARMKLWSSLGKSDRAHIKHSIQSRNRCIAEAQTAIDAGTATERQRIFIAKGAWRTKRHADATASAAALRLAKLQHDERQSTSMLQFRLQHSTGCVVDNCPLRSDAPLCLLEQDHRDPRDKVDQIARLKGGARLNEVGKTDCKCLWHHFLHTREDRNFQPVDSQRCLQMRDLGRLKETAGCQHPCHSGMPYASLVPPATDDPRMYAFLEVAHHRVGTHGGRSKTHSIRVRRYMEDLGAGIASIYCAFCHAIYTVCEKAKMCRSPMIQFQFKQIEQMFPAMVEFFHHQTHGVNWVAEREKICNKISLGMIQARSRKRKREDAQE